MGAMSLKRHLVNLPGVLRCEGGLVLLDQYTAASKFGRQTIITMVIKRCGVSSQDHQSRDSALHRRSVQPDSPKGGQMDAEEFSRLKQVQRKEGLNKLR